MVGLAAFANGVDEVRAGPVTSTSECREAACRSYALAYDSAFRSIVPRAAQLRASAVCIAAATAAGRRDPSVSAWIVAVFVFVDRP